MGLYFSEVGGDLFSFVITPFALYGIFKKKYFYLLMVHNLKSSFLFFFTCSFFFFLLQYLVFIVICIFLKLVELFHSAEAFFSPMKIVGLVWVICQIPTVVLSWELFQMMSRAILDQEAIANQNSEESPLIRNNQYQRLDLMTKWTWRYGIFLFLFLVKSSSKCY